MAFAVVVSVYLVSLAILASSQSDDFGEQVKQDLSNDAYDKIFATNFDKNSINYEILTADTKAVSKFYSIVGIFPKLSTLNEIRKETLRTAKEGKLSPEFLSSAVFETIHTFLDQKGLLKKGDVSDYAQKLADALETAAKDLSKGDDLTTTFPALIGATANFLKSLGLTTQQDVDLEQQILVKELKKL